MTKKLGSYFTPELLLKFSLSKIPEILSNKKSLSILEPSCGDGRFISEAISQFRDKKIDATLVEINDDSLVLAKENLRGVPRLKICQGDFLFFDNELKKYDLVIGNPPYINKKLLDAKQITQIRNVLDEASISSRADKNIWPSFIAKSTQMLCKTGTLCMVLPFDLLQVKYGEDVQAFLERNFSLIKIYNIKGRSFDSADQNTLVLVASKGTREKGLFYEEIQNLDLASVKSSFASKKDRKQRLSTSSLKWSSLALSDTDLSFLEAQARKLSAVGSYIDSKPGLVTAANSFFIVNQKTLSEYKLTEYGRPIIQKGSMVNGEATITKERYEKIRLDEKPCFFLDFSSYRRGASKDVDNYLEYGESLKIHERYKCSIRNHWYQVPIIDPGEALFFKRCHLYPKLLNNKHYYTTDSAYNINAREGYNVESFISSFYNPLTLCFAELMGRHYAGGVLELTPNEFRALPLPYSSVDNKKYRKFLNEFANKTSIIECISSSELEQEMKSFGISSNGFRRLIKIYKKLVTSRISNAM